MSNPGSINVTGYGSLSNPAPQPFAARDIVLLSDGYCSSTCTIFAELMREQGNVTIVAIGGRPINKPMQGVGGTRGSETKLGADIQGYANATLTAVGAVYGADALKQVESSAVGRLNNPVQLIKRTSIAEDSSFGIQINFRNAFRQNDTAQVPLQFIDQMADCKIFYTYAGFTNVTNVWKLVADVKWGNKSCVEGSTGDPTAISSQNNAPSFNNKTIPATTQKNSTSAAGTLGVPGISVALLAGLVVLAL